MMHIEVEWSAEKQEWVSQVFYLVEVEEVNSRLLRQPFTLFVQGRVLCEKAISAPLTWKEIIRFFF